MVTAERLIRLANNLCNQGAIEEATKVALSWLEKYGPDDAVQSLLLDLENKAPSPEWLFPDAEELSLIDSESESRNASRIPQALAGSQCFQTETASSVKLVDKDRKGTTETHDRQATASKLRNEPFPASPPTAKVVNKLYTKPNNPTGPSSLGVVGPLVGLPDDIDSGNSWKEELGDPNPVDTEELLLHFQITSDSGTDEGGGLNASATEEYFSESELFEWAEEQYVEALESEGVAFPDEASQEERCRQVAIEFIDSVGWEKETLGLVEEIFSVHGWSRCKRSLTDEISRGMTPEELEVAFSIRQFWSQEGAYACVGVAGTRYDSYGTFLSWPLALKIIRRFRGLPSLEEVEAWLFEKWDYWERILLTRPTVSNFSGFIQLLVNGHDRYLPPESDDFFSTMHLIGGQHDDDFEEVAQINAEKIRLRELGLDIPACRGFPAFKRRYHEQEETT